MSQYLSWAYSSSEILLPVLSFTKCPLGFVRRMMISPYAVVRELLRIQISPVINSFVMN